MSESDQTFDPWAPLNSKPREICGQNDFDSERYLSKLEAKLAKLQGKSQQPHKARELIDGLAGLKSAQMNDLFDSSYIPATYEHTEERADTSLTALQRRLNPEQPVNEEETKKLVDHDDLNKRVEAMFASEEEPVAENGDTQRAAPPEQNSEPSAETG